MRAVFDINNSIHMAINNYIKRGALPLSEGVGYHPDFSHSTALFLKNRNRRTSCEAVTQEYNSLLLALYSTIRCEWRLSLDDRISKTYKAACLLLEDRGTNSFVLSSLQREALELYVEGTEHFCPMKCLCWRIELENEMIPVSDQVYEPAPEVGL